MVGRLARAPRLRGPDELVLHPLLPDETTLKTGAQELVTERFGHWLPMAKMVYDARQELQFLKSRPEVDASRLGFIGFSLGGKAALYVGAFAPEITAAVSVDPHISLHGDTNWHEPWYLDWKHVFPTSGPTTIRSPNSAGPSGACSTPIRSGPASSGTITRSSPSARRGPSCSSAAA